MMFEALMTSIPVPSASSLKCSRILSILVFIMSHHPRHVQPWPPPAHAQAQAQCAQAQAHDTQAQDERPPPPDDGVKAGFGGGALAWFRTPRNPSTLPTTPADVDSTEWVMDLAKDSTLVVVWFVGAGAFAVPACGGMPDGCCGTPP